MSRESDEELLFEFACWNDDIRNTRGIPTLMDRVRAFLAERTPTNPGGPPCYACGSPVQRYWRVFPERDGDNWFWLPVVSGGTIMDVDLPSSPRRPTREAAESDGRASGLPEWKPPGGA